MPELPFRTLRPWLLETYGGPLHRVALDAGSSCPNRDGTKGFGGCSYCDVEGSGTNARASGVELADQLEVGLRRIARREPRARAIAYFQSYSNTYVSRERLVETLAVVEPHLGGVGGEPGAVAVVSVATRPDSITDEALAVLRELGRRVPVWVELGLEAADDGVLLAENRLHTVAEFHEAVRRVHSAGLLCVGHAILGLPGDGREGARRTARALAMSGVSGVKVHHLMILRRTQLEKRWRAGEVEVLDADTYLQWLADFIERLGPRQVLHRMSGEAPGAKLLAPYWDAAKNVLRTRLVEELDSRGTRQGSLARPEDERSGHPLVSR